MKTNIMLDLETLGQTAGSIILSIGAVKFGDGEILAEYYTRVDPESCVRAGLRMDVSTVMWWMKQNDAARGEIGRPGVWLGEALDNFAEWVGDPDACIWGNGASFDPVVLGAAYAAAGIEIPWRWWNERCYRTIAAMHREIKLDRDGTHHNALDDARNQAGHLMRIFNDQMRDRP